MKDKANSTDELNKANSKTRQAQRKKDSTATWVDSGLPILAVIEPLSLEAGGAGNRGYQKMGWGEFEPADGARSVDYVRYLFLGEIREMELAEHSWRATRKRLELLKELSATPLIEFKKAKPSKEQLNKMYANPYSGFEPRLLQLQKAVENWARRWYLNAPWCLSAAFATLRLWMDYSKAHELLLWDNNFPMDKATSFLPKDVADTAPFQGLPPFFAHIELRSAYTARMKERIKRQLEANPLTAKIGRKLQRLVLSADMKKVKAYCGRVMSIYESQRDQKGMAVWKRVRERAALERDIRWAIEFQVRGRSARAIAREEEIKRNLGGSIQGLPHTTVTRSVNFILELIDLPKRTTPK